MDYWIKKSINFIQKESASIISNFIIKKWLNECSLQIELIIYIYIYIFIFLTMNIIIKKCLNFCLKIIIYIFLIIIIII